MYPRCHRGPLKIDNDRARWLLRMMDFRAVYTDDPRRLDRPPCNELMVFRKAWMCPVCDLMEKK